MAISRRLFTKASLSAGALMTVSPSYSAVESQLIQRHIPSTGETLPIIGVGTNRYGVGDNQDPEPTNPDVTSTQDISVEISDTSSYIIAGSIAFLAIVILFVRRKQPPQPHIDSHHVANDSMWNDD